jgi:DNA mismatch repair protein MutS
MTFQSVLFEAPEDAPKQVVGVPDFFVDLNLNQIVDAIVAGREEYGLRPIFFATLKTADAVKYRHEIMRDLEDPALRDALQAFATTMRAMRRYRELADKVINELGKKGWFVDAVEAYCDAVSRLRRDLAPLALKSRGLSSFRDYLKSYVESSDFSSLSSETQKMRAALDSARYCLLIKDNQIVVRKYEGEQDYSVDLERSFDRFKRGATRDYRIRFNEYPELNHIEGQALDIVARLYPDVFQALGMFRANHGKFLDATITGFDREIQFYIGYLEFISRFHPTGLQFCYPVVSETNKEVHSRDGFDLALAAKLLAERSMVVCNDFYLEGSERIFVVNGPNQGGKTTFARSFGQVHYLAALGLTVPGRDAQLFLFDRIFTHFEREENINDLRSKLEDDLVRIHSILSESTPRSIIIINELFSSSTLHDAVFLGKEVLADVIRLDALCVYVTFLDELSTLDKTVSMLSTVNPDNPERCTFKIVRRPADGLAYALAVARKHRLSYEGIKERIRP